MLDFDEILVSIKNPQIHKYVNEAIKSYRIGNYRSAVLAVWIAAMFDLVKKFEILVDQRESTATEAWKRLKPRIEAHQNWEKDLIQSAGSISMISRYEAEMLESLMHTRNRYAHPSFNDSGSLFDPTAEEVRYFIRTLYDIVLSQPAQLGTFYVNQLLDSIQSPNYFSSQPYSDDIAHLEENVFGKIERVNKRQIPRLFKELFQALNSPNSKDHELNILCFLVNAWGNDKEWQCSFNFTENWDNYLLSKELNITTLSAIISHPECISDLSEISQQKIDSAFRKYFIKGGLSSDSAVKFLASADTVPLAHSILCDAADLIPIDRIIEQSYHYHELFGEKFEELFGMDILDGTRKALRTCNGYVVNPVLSTLRKCNLWELANNLAPEEQMLFSGELIASLNCNNFETMNLLSFCNRDKIPLKWIKLLFDKWTSVLKDDSWAQEKIPTYLMHYIGLFERYINELDDSRLGDGLQIINSHASKKISELGPDDEAWNAWQNLIRSSKYSSSQQS